MTGVPPSDSKTPAGDGDLASEPLLVTGTPLVACARCSEIASDRDDWCAICGTALRGLTLSSDEVVVTETALTAEVEVVAQGILPTTFVIPRRHLAKAPKWVMPQVEADVAITLQPGDAHAVEFAFSPEFLPQGRGDEEEPGHYSLSLATAGLTTDAAGLAARTQAVISLVSPSRARVRPAYAHTRLLPLQRVSGANMVAREVTLVNAGGHRTRLKRVWARDTGWQEGAGQAQRRVKAKDLIVCPPLSAAKMIEAGEDVRHGFAFQISDAVAASFVGPTPIARPFDVEIVFDLEDDSGQGEARSHQVAARLSGVLGAAPDVVLTAGAVAPVRTHGARTEAEIKITNPGVAAVTVSDVVALPIGGEDTGGPNEAPEWLRIDTKWASPVTIGAGATVGLTVTIDPDRRQGAALKQAWDECEITLHHDGWQEASARALSFRLSAELGEVVALNGAVVGIDFGTSSSAVSLLHGESGRAFSLPLEPDQGREELPSVLFYRGDDPPFLFGTEAENAAPLAFSNVVRSIKSVVAKDPNLSWAFFERQAEATAPQLRTFQSEELLSRFLLEVKRRAEQGTRKLPHEFLDALDLTGRGVRLSNAVFTHPVAVTEPALRALHRAATAAGLVDDKQASFDAFVAEACLDEALAAVLAFVFVLAGEGGGEAAPLREQDALTLLSVDVGGGTSDLAAVRVRGLASFLSGAGQTVDVELIASGGERRLGGDDFDRALAESVLERLKGRPETSGCDLDGVRRALAHPSFESFRRGENAHHHDHQQIVWTARSSLLRICEEKKRELSRESQVQLAPFVVPWPGSDRFAERLSHTANTLELTVTQKDAAAVYAPLLSRLSASVRALLKDAGLEQNTIDAVLFTGKGSRLRPLSDAVMDAFDAHTPLALRPQSVPGFDEKSCVATGAAVWGDSRSHGGGWLTVQKRASTQLDASLTLRRGPRFAPVPGLEAGTSLPATGTVTLGAVTSTVVLYRQGRAALTFELDAPVSRLEVTVEGQHKAYAVIDGVRVAALASEG